MPISLIIILTVFSCAALFLLWSIFIYKEISEFKGDVDKVFINDESLSFLFENKIKNIKHTSVEIEIVLRECEKISLEYKIVERGMAIKPKESHIKLYINSLDDLNNANLIKK